MKHGSLFSGIGGFELAASWMGWQNIFNCENNQFCRRILKYWFQNSINYDDIRSTDFSKWNGKIDILTGGFPCQPFSNAGRRQGADDDRYLWPEMLRVIRQIQPTWVIGENVNGIISMVQPGKEIDMEMQTSLFQTNYKETILEQQYVVETVCNNLESAGYTVQPIVIPACAVGAPHRRDRVWFIAYRTDSGIEMLQQKWEDGILSNGFTSNTECFRGFKIHKDLQSQKPEREKPYSIGNEWLAANSERIRLERGCNQKKSTFTELFTKEQNTCRCRPWKEFPTQSPICSRNDGISERLDGITFSKWRKESVKAYGNAIVPQVAYEIFKSIELINKTL